MPFILVPQLPLYISQSTNDPVSGQPYNLTCNTTALGVSHTLVMLNWKKKGSLSEYMEIRESPRVMMSDMITNGSQILRTIKFLPLLRSDAGEYLCTVIVLGNFNGYNARQFAFGVNGM